jgi:hypothetical protein
MGRPTMGKCKDKTSPYIARKRPNLKSIKEDMKNYHWAMFKHVMEFLKQCASLNKPLLEHYFINFFERFINQKLVRPL